MNYKLRKRKGKIYLGIEYHNNAIAQSQRQFRSRDVVYIHISMKTNIYNRITLVNIYSDSVKHEKIYLFENSTGELGPKKY